MSIAVKFYSFSKKKNSTALPSGGTTFNCYLKDPCTVLNPRIVLSTNNPAAYNYAYIVSFNRYYFITDWESDHDMWIANLTVDVLASYKMSILNSTQYVLRSASERNSYIADSSYPMDTAVDYICTRLGEGLTAKSPFFNTYRYIIGITNGNSYPKINGVQYLCLEPEQLGAILYGTLNPQSNYWDPGGTSGVSDSIYRSIVNPLQYFGEAYMLPVIPNSIFLGNVTDNELKVGSWVVPYSGTQLKAITGSPFADALGYIYWNTLSVSLPIHPQASTHGEYLKASPYSKYYLYAGPFGMVTLDTSLLTDDGIYEPFNISISVSVDFKGGAVLEVTANQSPFIGTILAKAYANVSVPISLTQTKNNTISWLGQAAGAVGSALTGNIAGAISGAAGLISGSDSLVNKPEVKGIQGSSSCISEPWYLQSEFHKVVCRDGDLPMNIIGYPLCETRLLSELSGFCQTSDPWLDLQCYDSEYGEIISYLKDGFYIDP